MNFAQRLVVGYFRTKFKLLTVLSKKKAAEKAFELFCTPQRRTRKKEPKIFEEAEKVQFLLDDIRICGWRWPNTTGRKVLILHGYESSVINFDRYVRPLIKKGYEVLAFDAPGHGQSGGKQINAPLYKKFIVEICRKFGPVQAFMAHSFGGLGLSIAMEEISHTPEHKVVLIAPATETTTAINSFFNFLKLDEKIRVEFDKVIIRRSGVTPAWFSIRRAMRNIQAQVLWLHDEDDDITPLKDALKVKEDGHANLEFVITKGLGHRRIYRENKVTKRIIDFL